MGQQPAKSFPWPTPFGQSPDSNVVNQAIAPPKAPLNNFLSLNQAEPQAPAQAPVSQPTQSKLPTSIKNPIIKGLLGFILLTAFAWGTTTVTGNMKSLGAGNVTGAFMRFYLRGCNGNQPRVSGVGLIAPTLGGVFYFDLPTNSSGVVSGTLYSNRDVAGTGNGEIECGGSYTATWYGMQAFFGGKAGPEVAVLAKNTATLDISTVTPITVNPVVTAPTGDSTYARLDSGNQPFLGGLQATFGTFSGALTSASLTTQQVNATIYATPGETVAHAVSRLPVGGGKVMFDVGVYPSGGVVISTPNIWLEGAGMPNYNSATAPTALTGGTVFQGQLSVIQGGDHFVIRNAGVDAGSTWINANNGGVATNALAITNNGQVVGATPVQAPIIENVACLGFSAAAAFHCMLVENVANAYVHNVQTVYNQHGLVLKGTGSRVDGVYARGHGNDSVIVKSDNYAPANDDTLTNINIFPLAAAGDTKGMILQGVGAVLSDIQVSNVDIIETLSFGIQVQGVSASFSANNIHFSNILINYQSASPASHYCIQFVQYVTVVAMDNFYCANYNAGVNFNLPVNGFTNDFALSNAHFINNATTSVETYGRWQISNGTFIGNGTAISSDANSVAVVANNTFASNSTDMGGSGNFAFAGAATLAVASLPTCNAALEGKTQPVNNANSAVFNAAVAAGGANHILAYCNGTGWVVH